jgi:hypothetical protein
VPKTLSRNDIGFRELDSLLAQQISLFRENISLFRPVGGIVIAGKVGHPSEIIGYLQRICEKL